MGGHLSGADRQRLNVFPLQVNDSILVLDST
jgi:hypothetical protein